MTSVMYTLFRLWYHSIQYNHFREHLDYLGLTTMSSNIVSVDNMLSNYPLLLWVNY